MMARPSSRSCLTACVTRILMLAGTAQAATNIAGWEGLRGAQIQSKLVLEGGLMTNGTFDGGQWKDTAIVQHSYGVYYQIDLTKSFDAKNQSTDAYMIAGLPETSNTQAPNYIAGGIFNNDYQFYTFGGLADRPPIDASTVLLGNVFPAAPSLTRFDQGVSPIQQTDGVSDNITSGLYASSPDQGLGFYLSGMVSATRGKLEYNSDDDADNHPTIASPTFIKVDMTTANDAKFQYMNWPSNLTARSEGALIWLPYGKQGVLLAIGGVEYPGDRYLISAPQDTPDGPFMTELAIYDIDADAWHTQQTLETEDKPTQLAGFCTAVVPTQDGNSHEIFVYGGYDGTYTSSNPSVRDDVWVLSVPAFQWTKVKTATSGSTHGRQNSVCFAPNPTTMITVGGTDTLGGSLKSDTIIDVLDLNTLEWTGQYNASSDTAFSLPAAVVTQLKYPSAAGPGDNAQATGLNNTLGDLFSTKYSGTVQSYFPYANLSSGSTPDDGGQPKAHSKSKWKIPVIATLCTVGGLAILALLLFCCLRRRRKNQKGEKRMQQSRKNVFSWLGKSSHVDPEAEKSNTSGETAVESNPEYYNQKAPEGDVYEAPSHVTSSGWTYGAASRGGPHEIMDSSQRGSITDRNHPYHPKSLSGDRVHSPPSGSQSRFSEGLPPSQNAGVVHELPHEKSRDNLAHPHSVAEIHRSTTRTPLDDDAPVSATSNGRGNSISDGTAPTPITPMEPSAHRRNVSSVGSSAPSLPSPNAEEDMRRSRQIAALPDMLSSPTSHRQRGLESVTETRHT